MQPPRLRDAAPGATGRGSRQQRGPQPPAAEDPGDRAPAPAPPPSGTPPAGRRPRQSRRPRQPPGTSPQHSAARTWRRDWHIPAARSNTECQWTGPAAINGAERQQGARRRRPSVPGLLLRSGQTSKIAPASGDAASGTIASANTGCRRAAAGSKPLIPIAGRSGGASAFASNRIRRVASGTPSPERTRAQTSWKPSPIAVRSDYGTTALSRLIHPCLWVCGFRANSCVGRLPLL